MVRRSSTRLVLGRVLSRSWGDAAHIGLMVPPTVPAAVANLAVSLWGKIPVNLNYSANQEVVDSSVKQCGITHVLTSAKVLDKFKIVPKGTLILLEDIPKQVPAGDKLWAAAVAKLVPTKLLGAFVPGLRGDRLDAEATVIFTSGSTGDPKGVMLSHRNILSNAHQIEEQVHLQPDEVVLGILPFFHSFGFTVTIWTAHGTGQEGGLPLQSARCPDDRQALRPAQGDPAGRHALVHPVLLEELRAEAVPDAHSPDPRRREAQAGVRPGNQGDPGHRTPGGLWVHGTLSGRCRERPARGRTTGRTHRSRQPAGDGGLPMPGTAIKTIDPESGADLPRAPKGSSP